MFCVPRIKPRGDGIQSVTRSVQFRNGGSSILSLTKYLLATDCVSSASVRDSRGIRLFSSLRNLPIQWGRLIIIDPSGVIPTPATPQTQWNEGYFLYTCCIYLVNIYWASAMSDSRSTTIIVNKNHHGPLWSLHYRGGRVIDTQLNKELLDYSYERETLKEKYRLLREAPMTSALN